VNQTGGHRCAGGWRLGAGSGESGRVLSDVGVGDSEYLCPTATKITAHCSKIGFRDDDSIILARHQIIGALIAAVYGQALISCVAKTMVSEMRQACAAEQGDNSLQVT